MTELIEAVKSNDRAAVKELLRCGANIDEEDGLGHTALVWTVTKGYAGIARLLIENHAEVDKKGGMSGFTALMHTIAWGRKEIMCLLLDNGANVHEENKLGGTALRMAAEYGQMEMARLLIDHGAVLDTGETERYPAMAPILQEVNEQRVRHAVALKNQQWLNQVARSRPKPV